METQFCCWVTALMIVFTAKLFHRALAGLALAFGLGWAVSAATPNDPKFGAEWYLKKIGTPAAWE